MSDLTDKQATQRTRDHITNLLKGDSTTSKVGTGFSPVGHVREAEHRKGHWKVTPNEGIAVGSFVSKPSKTAQVPLTGGRHAEVVRLHEAEHLARRFTLDQVKALKIPLTKLNRAALHASEEICVNGTLTNNGFVKKKEWAGVHAADGHPIGSSADLVKTMEKAYTVYNNTGVETDLERAKFQLGVRASAGLGVGDHNKVPPWAKRLAAAGAALFAEPSLPNQRTYHKEWDKVNAYAEAHSRAESAKSGAMEALRAPKEGRIASMLDQVATKASDTITKGRPGSKPGGDESLAKGKPRVGTLTTINLPLTERTTLLGEGRRWKLTDDPSPMLKRPSRLMRYGDRVAFRRRTPPAKGGMGSFLIDASGSMGWDSDQIVALLKAIPRANIAIYAGRRDRGEMYIVSIKGRMASQHLIAKAFGDLGGNNVVDLPALDWLAQQPEPRVWVSDGYATEVGDGLTPRVVMACGLKCKANRITRYEKKELLPGSSDD